MEKPNRAERRKSKFGGGRSTAHGGWPAVAPNPAFHAETPADEASPAASGDEARKAREAARPKADDEADSATA